MTLEEQQKLKEILAQNKSKIVWISPHDLSCHTVKAIGYHAEEGDGILCAIFNNSTYVALYNAELSDFAVIERLK